MFGLRLSALLLFVLSISTFAFDANGAETDDVFDYEIAKLEADIKELNRVISVKDMSKETKERIRIELSLLQGQVGILKSTKVTTDASLRIQHARTILIKYNSTYSFSLTFGKDYRTRRKLVEEEISRLEAELAKIKGLQKKLERHKKPQPRDKEKSGKLLNAEAHLVDKNKQSAVHLVPGARIWEGGIGLGGKRNSALLTSTSIKSGHMNILFRRSSRFKGDKSFRGWSTSTDSCLDGVVCDKEHIFAFVITFVDSSTQIPQNIMEWHHRSYSINVYDRASGQLLSTLEVHPRMSSQHRLGRTFEELVKDVAGPLTLAEGGVRCFDRVFIIKQGKLVEKREQKPKPLRAEAIKKSDFELIQGTWESVSVQHDGKVKKSIVSYQITFAGKKWNDVRNEKYEAEDGKKTTWVKKLDRPSQIFSLKTDAKPKQISLVGTLPIRGVRPERRGIYKCEGDILTLCMDVNRKPPSDFTTIKGDDRTLYVLKRKKGREDNTAEVKKEKKPDRGVETEKQSDENTGVVLKEINSTVRFEERLVIGGTIVGPDGNLADGDERFEILHLVDGGKPIEIHGSLLVDLKLKPSRKYRVFVRYDRTKDEYELREIWDGDKKIYPPKFLEPIEKIFKSGPDITVHHRWTGSNCGVTTASEKVIQDKDAWEKLWKELHRNSSPTPKLPKLDFETQAVLAVFLGQQNSGGHNIQFKHIRKTDNNLEVEVQRIRPVPPVTQALTQPYDIVVIAKPGKAVKFVKK